MSGPGALDAPAEASSSSSAMAPAAKKAQRKPRIAVDLASLDPAAVLAMNRKVAPPFQILKHKRDAAKNWNVFYRRNEDRFFKDRHWTTREFEELLELGVCEGDEKGKGKTVMEVGCGVGNFFWPLLKEFPTARFYAFDFSARAIEIIRSDVDFDAARLHAFEHDLTFPLSALQAKLSEASWNDAFAGETPIPPDVISAIFVLSALAPSSHLSALATLVATLAPGGTLLLRDYALHDQAQLRFHMLPSANYAAVPSLLSPEQGEGDEEEAGKHWYRRGDGTMAYFFEVAEFAELARKAAEQAAVELVEERLGVIEREVTNRAEGGRTMKRRFVQGVWRRKA